MLVPNTSGERLQTLNLVTIYLIVARGQLAWRDMCRCAGVQEWWLLRLPTSGQWRLCRQSISTRSQLLGFFVFLDVYREGSLAFIGGRWRSFASYSCTCVASRVFGGS